MQNIIQTLGMAEGLSLKEVGKVISYIVTVVIGGVGYKYLSLWLTHSKDKADRDLQANESLISNLEERIKALTTRVTELESKREESYRRELGVTKMLAKAEQKVELLEEKVRMLERNQKVLQSTIDKYYTKYGPLDEIE